MRTLLRCGMLLGAMTCAVLAWAQGPYIAYLYPAGGKQGTVLRVTVGGQRLRGVDEIYVTGQGVRATVVGFVGAGGLLNAAQEEELRKRVRELINKRLAEMRKDPRAPKQPEKAPAPNPPNGEKPVTLPDLPELRNLEQMTLKQLQQVADTFLNRQKRPKPPMAEVATLEITIDPGAAPGDRELRLRTGAGLTNPMIFQVGSLPEVCEPDRTLLEPPPFAPVEAPVVLNGQIMPGEVDRFPLQLKAGQSLLIAAEARYLIPYLADAVPGWFQAVMRLSDPEGKEVAFADDCGFDPDPILSYRVPADGTYTLEMRDAIYRGREDFVYRIAVGDPPQVRALFPSGRRGGILLTGNPTPVTLPWGETMPRRAEVEPNDTPKQAPVIALPQIISGRITRPGDVDVYQFSGRTGDEVVMEVYARRAGSLLDGLLRVRDATGRVLAWNDDCEDKSTGLLTHHADAYLAMKLPATGTYFVEVSDTQQHGGDAYSYDVRISPRQPDFALRVSPASINVDAGRMALLTVHAIRKDGWDGEIEVGLQGAPAGFVLTGARIPAGRDTIRMTLTAPRERSNQPRTLHLEGRAQIDGNTVTRPVLPTEQLMQAFAYYHLVPAQQLAVLITGGGRFWPTFERTTADRVRIPSGGQVQVAFKVRLMPKTPLRLELSDPPPGVRIQDVTVVAGGITCVLVADDKHLGYADNLIIEASTEAEWKRPGSDVAQKQRVSLGILPAIPFEIEPR